MHTPLHCTSAAVLALALQSLEGALPQSPCRRQVKKRQRWRTGMDQAMRLQMKVRTRTAKVPLHSA